MSIPSGIGEIDSISVGSIVENIADAFDNSESSYARMLADGETNSVNLCQSINYSLLTNHLHYTVFVRL